MVLDKEREYFEAHRKEWLKEHAGKFALIKGEQLLGVFDSAEAALEAGAERLGHEPFLIKPILASDPVEHAPALVYGLMNADL
jgi:hypothetical protein